MTATVAELETITAAAVVDARGSACPGPLLEAKKSMVKVPVGSVIEIWSTDPATKNDISAWSGKVGHDFMGVLEADGYDRVFVTPRQVGASLLMSPRRASSGNVAAAPSRAGAMRR